MRMLGMNLEPRLDVNLNDSMFFAKAIGEEVKKIFTGGCSAGRHAVVWKGGAAPGQSHTGTCGACCGSPLQAAHQTPPTPHPLPGPAAACTKDQYDRGVGTVPTGCPSHAPEEFSAL